MTTIKKWLNNRYVIGWSLIFWATVDLILIGIQCQLTKSDWGTWVGSVGTVGTLIGTIWLATWNKRDAQKQAHDRAIVAASSLLPRLAIINTRWSEASEKIGQGEIEKQADLYAVYAAYLEDAGTWTDDEILPLIVLPNRLCSRLANLRPIMNRQMREMRDLSAIYKGPFGRETFERRHAEIEATLKRIQHNIKLATTECENAVLADFNRN